MPKMLPRHPSAYRWFRRNAFHGIHLETYLTVRVTYKFPTRINRSMKHQYAGTYFEASEQALYKLLSDTQETS